MPTTKITMVGLSGSGKTCYLAGMYNIMSCGLKGFTLSADWDTDNELEALWETLRDSSKGEKRFPAPSDEVRNYDFKLKYGMKEIMTFKWLDYPGDSLRASSDTEDVKKFKEYLKESSCLFICVDGKAFSEEVEDPAYYIRSELGAKRYMHILNEFESVNKRIPPIVIVVTKFDLCKRSGEEVKDIIKEVFSPLFTEPNGYDKLVSIIPVTLGKNIAENGGTGKLEPKNIYLPVAFGIYCAIQGYVNDLISKNTNKLSELSGIRDSFFGKMFKGDTIKGLESEIQLNADEIKKMEQDAARLSGELLNSNIPVYLNGVEKKLS
ncbi:MAG: hypothetical protein N3B21_08705 [Clostridia bacterium]|nr:hypothetical protein [Clostridia bacterium]